ncbi:MAG: L-threonine 3-dehydrogenase [Chlamydiales bacterium]
MKAILKKEPREGLWIEEVPMPNFGENDLLIKTLKTSICGTDIHLYLWDEWAKKVLPVPSIIGHEFVGKVVAVGKHVQGFKIGDRVSGEGHLTCGRCYMCQTGRRVLCPQTIGVGVNRNGCFAEYLVIPAENAFLVPDSIPNEIASLFDPLGNAVHTALFCNLVSQDVLITGAGPIGLMAVAIAKKAGARHVVISDLNPYRLALAEKIGATAAVNIKEESLQKVMKKLGMRAGFDVCLEMSGNSEAFASLPDVCTHGGHLVLLGILPSHATLDWHQVIFKMLTIKGIYGREIFKTWYQVTSLLESGLNISPVITHHILAEEFQKGFEIMLSGNSGKVILDWSYL